MTKARHLQPWAIQPTNYMRLCKQCGSVHLGCGMGWFCLPMAQKLAAKITRVQGQNLNTKAGRAMYKAAFYVCYTHPLNAATVRMAHSAAYNADPVNTGARTTKPWLM